MVRGGLFLLPSPSLSLSSHLFHYLFVEYFEEHPQWLAFLLCKEMILKNHYVGRRVVVKVSRNKLIMTSLIQLFIEVHEVQTML